MEIEIALSGTAVEGKKDRREKGKKKKKNPNWISRDLDLSFLTLPSDLGGNHSFWSLSGEDHF